MLIPSGSENSPQDAIDKSILDDFKKESIQLLSELSEIVGGLEEVTDHFPAEQMREFSQKIDRIMGAAKTLALMAPSNTGFERIGKLAELCKGLGYKAAEKQTSQLIPIFAGFWGDTIEVIQELTENIEDEAKVGQISGKFSAVLQKRLEWLVKRVGAAGGTPVQLDDQLQELMRKIGM